MVGWRQLDAFMNCASVIVSSLGKNITLGKIWDVIPGLGVFSHGSSFKTAPVIL